MIDHGDITHITGTVLTVEEGGDLLRQIQEALHRLHSAAARPAEALAETLGQEHWERVQDVCARRRLSLDDATTLRELLHALQLRLINLPVMTVAVAFAPRHEFVVSLTEQLAEAGLPPLRLALATDPSLVGGAVVEWDGRVLDYSLRTNLEPLLVEEFVLKKDSTEA